MTVFNVLYNSGSEFKVVDPVTNQENKFYFISSSDTTTVTNTWDGGGYPSILNNARNRLIWVNYLNKFVTTTAGSGPYLSTDGLHWTSASAANTASAVDSTLAASDELSIIVSNLNASGQNTIGYSTDGVNWNIGTASVSNTADAVGYSPTLQRFVCGMSNVFVDGVGIVGAMAYSDDGIHFTVVSGSNVPSASNLIYGFQDIIWDSSGSQFVALGTWNDANPGTSASIYTSTNGETWQIKSVISPKVSTNYGYTRIIAASGSYIVTGDPEPPFGSPQSSSIVYSTNLTNWTFVSNLPTQPINAVEYSPTLNKFVAVGPINTLHSTDGINWYTGSTSNTINTSNIACLAWSPTLNQFVGMGSNYGPTMRSYDGIEFLTQHESYVGNVGFASTPAGTLLNTPLTPWTGSNSNFAEKAIEYGWIDLELQRGAANPYDSGPLTYYHLTSSYGIIIDSSSLSNFYLDYFEPGEMEDVMIGDTRYLREITTEYESSAYVGYITTAEPYSLTISPNKVSTFSGSFKAAGRSYFGMYYGVYGYDINNQSVYLQVNLDDGVVEYYEDALNRNNEGSYNISQGDFSMAFVNPPTMTDKGDGYWELAFKVGFIKNEQLSGSITIT